VNSEFYPGWLDFWGSPHSKVDTFKVLDTFNQMMDLGANVNFYMFHGGTNFGWSNGEPNLRKLINTALFIYLIFLLNLLNKKQAPIRLI
jgi:hypothetical protein